MLPPMVERELRVALLRRKAHGQWLAAAWAAGAVTLLSILIVGLASNRSSGRMLFQWLFALALLRVVTQGFSLTTDLFSEERRNGTLGLLVLTGMQPIAIFTSKLLGAMVLAIYGLLGAMPFFAITFLAGGVPVSQFVCGLASLATTLLFCVAAGLLASVLHRDGGQAQFVAQALAAVLCLATPLLYWLSG